MKLNRMIAAGFLCLCAGLSQAEMISGVISYRLYKESQFSISARYDTGASDSTISFLHSYGPTKTFFSLLRFERLIKPVGVNVPFDGRLYLVNKGDVVTGDRVAAGQFKLMNVPHGGLFKDLKDFTVGREFWLLVAIRSNTGTPPTYKSFSWAHMKFNVWNQLEMLDSITAYEEPGLVVGEKTPCKAQACLDAAAP